MAFQGGYKWKPHQCLKAKFWTKKEAHIFKHLDPYSVTADNAYTKAMRIRNWAKAGLVLITPAFKWVTGRYAQNYHRFLQQTENQDLIRLRRTAIEPIFDLIAS